MKLVRQIARTLTFGILAPLLASLPAYAMQTLIPTPYPSTVGADAQVLDPEPTPMGGPQRIMADPYPATLGTTAQGNPPIVGHHHHQHRVPTINERKYRVDRQ